MPGRHHRGMDRERHRQSAEFAHGPPLLPSPTKQIRWISSTNAPLLPELQPLSPSLFDFDLHREAIIIECETLTDGLRV